MVNIWNILGIEKTLDRKRIKKAYHAKLKITHPEDNQAAFMELREAYEQALDYAQPEDDGNNQVFYTFPQYEEENQEEHLEFPCVQLSKKEEKFEKWCKKVEELYWNYERRMDTENWRKLLYEDIPFQLDYYEMCRSWLLAFLDFPNSPYSGGQVWDSFGSIYLKRETRLLIDQFFSYTATRLERVRGENREKRMYQWLNKQVKLCEMIVFDKVRLEKERDDKIDLFFGIYQGWVEFLIKNNAFLFENAVDPKSFPEYSFLKKKEDCYLPFACMDLTLSFHQYSESRIIERIHELKEKFGDAAEIQLLQAEYEIDRGETEKAKKRLSQLYRKVPEKNYMVVYQMAVCCEKTGMYYEAYMLVKMLTSLNPKPFMYTMAEKIYEKIESQYQKKTETGEEISDMEHIALCRMYLRANREKDALKVLSKVKNPQAYLWEYEVAHCLCIFHEEGEKEGYPIYWTMKALDKEPEAILDMDAIIPIWKQLEAYPKDKLNGIEKLEWEELQGRYLFEQRKYEECDKKCNELLEEYPISYSILLLRGYADYAKNHIGSNQIFKMYRDMDYLISVSPQRLEARLMAAQMMMHYRWYDKACEVLEPVRKSVPDQMFYYSLLQYENTDRERFMEGLFQLFSKAKNHTLSIPPLSKYGLLDLHNIFANACEDNCGRTSGEKRKEFFQFLEGLQESKFNHPEKYMDWYWLYLASGRYEKALQIAKERLNRARSKIEKKRINRQIYRVNCWLGNVEEAEKNLQLLKEDKSQYTLLAQLYYKKCNYEKAAYYYALADRETLLLNEYYNLGKSYYYLEQYEKAIHAFRKGIQVWGKSDDNNNHANLYLEICCVYFKQKKWKEALNALDQMKKETHFQNIRDLYSENYFCVYDNQILWCSMESIEGIKELERIERELPKEIKIRLYDHIGYKYYQAYCNMEEEKDRQQMYEKASWYLTAAIDSGKARTFAYGGLVDMYKQEGRMKEAVAAAWKGIEASDGVGDYFGDKNLYRDIYWIYCEDQNWKEVKRIAKLMVEHTNLESIKNDYPWFLAYASINIGDYETAYTNLKKIKETPEYPYYGLNLDTDLFLSSYGMGDYDKVCSMALLFAEDDESNSETFLEIAFHSQFMKNGKVDAEFAWNIEQKIQKIMSKSKEKGECEAFLTQIYMVLEEKKQAEYYKQRAYQSLEGKGDDEMETLERMQAWCFAYQKEFEKAFKIFEKYYEENEICNNNTIEYRYLKKMVQNKPSGKKYEIVHKSI